MELKYYIERIILKIEDRLGLMVARVRAERKRDWTEISRDTAESTTRVDQRV